jgi:cephalosporin hydroxylase
MILFVARALRRLAHELLVLGAAGRIRRSIRAGAAADRASALDFAYSFDYGGLRIEPFQIRSEIDDLLRLLEAEPPRAIVEVGTAQGGTLFLFAAVAAPDAVLVTVDFPEGRREFGGNRDYRRRRRIFDAFARHRQRIAFIVGDSHDARTLGRVRDELDGRPVDLLFIDGDHTLEGVRRDYELYSPLVAETGIIAFHDIVPGPPALVGGVPEFWGEKKGASGRELVADGSQGGFGIGVLSGTAGP